MYSATARVEIPRRENAIFPFVFIATSARKPFRHSQRCTRMQKREAHVCSTFLGFRRIYSILSVGILLRAWASRCVCVCECALSIQSNIFVLMQIIVVCGGVVWRTHCALRRLLLFIYSSIHCIRHIALCFAQIDSRLQAFLLCPHTPNSSTKFKDIYCEFRLRSPDATLRRFVKFKFRRRRKSIGILNRSPPIEMQI